MAGPIARLSDPEKKRLLEVINYLNTEELRDFCGHQSIPFLIRVEMHDGRTVLTRDADRKGVVIDRILHFLNTGEIKPATVFPRSVIGAPRTSGRPRPTDCVLYGEYRNRDATILQLMKRLTRGRFEFGAIAQEVLRGCWAEGHAPSYEEFAQRWLQAEADHTKPNPEWAFLTDRANGVAGADWKKIRKQTAAEALALLAKAS